MTNILITGASGFLGQKLSKFLKEKGFQVKHLVRSVKTPTEFPAFLWDPEKGTIDPKCLDGIDAVINLAGAPIAGHLWSAKYKQVLMESRVKSAAVLIDLINQQANQVQTVISVSGTGYYGHQTHQVMTETSLPGTDFLAEVCQQWEKPFISVEPKPYRTVILRLGVVIGEESGFIKALKKPIRLGFGAVLGKSDAKISWIHEEDLMELFLFSLTQVQMSGIYNAVAPHAVANREMMRSLARHFHRPLFPLNIPAWLLRLLLGEMADVVLTDQQVSSKKLVETDFAFIHQLFSIE